MVSAEFPSPFSGCLKGCNCPGNRSILDQTGSMRGNTLALFLPGHAMSGSEFDSLFGIQYPLPTNFIRLVCN